MTKKLLITSLAIAILVVGCGGAVRIPGVPGGGGGGGLRPTRTPGPTAGAAAAIPTQVPYTPIPTYDVVSKLVTQAYALYTPTATSAATKAPAATAVPPTASAGGNASVPAATSSGQQVIVVPSSVIAVESVQINNFTNTAKCAINQAGDCTPAMKPNQTILMTWKFTNNSPRTFTWGDAAISITRDGQSFATVQAGNGLARVPPPDKNAKWQLAVNEPAEFRASLEKVQPGSYTAKLMICQNDPIDCRAGLGWQNVGGEYILFTVTQ